MSEEIWRDVPGYEGYYQVSNMGNVCSVDREVVDKRGVTRRLKGMPLKQIDDIHGYPAVGLCKDGVGKTYKVHVLVAKAFLNEEDKLSDIDHIDGDVHNNSASNLRYTTHADNMRYMRERLGIKKAPRQTEWEPPTEVVSFDSEVWVPIKGYENYYEVSSYGNVRSVDRHLTDKNGNTYFYHGVPIKPYRDKHGALRVSLHKDGPKKTPCVHVLVAENLIPNPNGYSDVDRVDGCYENNHVENLYWTTPLNKHLHLVELGRVSQDHFVDWQNSDRYVPSDNSSSCRPVRRSDGVVFESIIQAANETGCNRSNISDFFKGLLKSVHGYTFELIEPDQQPA